MFHFGSFTATTPRTVFVLAEFLPLSLPEQLEKMGRQLIFVRHRFHPLNAKELVLSLTALASHMIFQLWLYLSGRSEPCVSVS